MTTRMRHDRLPAACIALVVMLGVGVAGMQGADKSIFVSVVDAEGRPVTDMTAAEFAVREDGVDREVVSVTPAAQPLYIALLVDTSDKAEDYIQDIRAGFRAFIRDVLAKNPDAQISLWEFGQASIRIKDFTNDAAELDKAAARLFPKPKAPSVLLEALYDTSESLAKAPSRRRAIVSLNLEPGDEQSRQEPRKVNESLMKSRAQYFALSVQKGALKNPQHDLVLNTLTKNGGGLRESILTQQAIEQYMRRFAALLTSQYELTYKRPSGSARVVQTGVRRPGARALAGLFAPQ